MRVPKPNGQDLKSEIFSFYIFHRFLEIKNNKDDFATWVTEVKEDLVLSIALVLPILT